MRQWNVNPKCLCDKHLLGEHVEHHMFAGCIIRNKSLKGYIETGLVEIHNLKKRHDELVKEMVRRNMNHKSPFPDIKLYKAGKVNTNKNIEELKRRCSECKELIKNKG
jgi:hypothetical protein